MFCPSVNQIKEITITNITTLKEIRKQSNKNRNYLTCYFKTKQYYMLVKKPRVKAYFRFTPEGSSEG